MERQARNFMILKGAEPFFLPAGEKGVLLVHGFTGTPAEMLLLGEFLHKKNYTVLAPRLCGHGTSPEELAKTSWENWYHSVCDGFYLLQGMCREVSVIGLSMGALLAIHLGISYNVKKVIAISAPIYISSEKMLQALPPIEKSIGRYVAKRRRTLPDLPECCNVFYHKMPLLSVHQLLTFIEIMKKELPNVEKPLLIVQSKNDHTVLAESGEYIYTKIKSSDKEIFWLEKSGHIVTLDLERDRVFNKIVDFLAK